MIHRVFHCHHAEAQLVAIEDRCAALSARLDKLNELDRLAALKHLDALRERDEAIARAEKAERDAIRWEGAYQLAAVRADEAEARAERLDAEIARLRAELEVMTASRDRLAAECRAWRGPRYPTQPLRDARAAVDAAGDLGGAT